MARLCERPGCSVSADVCYGFDPETLIVWIDGFQAEQGAKSGVLCRRHADAMVVPLGWMLDDRRDPAPRLFRSPAEAPTGPMIRPRIKRPRPDPATAVVQLQLDAPPIAPESVAEPEPEPIVAAEPEPEPPVTPEPPPEPAVTPWQPVFDQRDDLKGLLKARGRLLSRAFNGIGGDDH
jgi:hypothetical protein